jgi:hypothetical protein
MSRPHFMPRTVVVLWWGLLVPGSYAGLRCRKEMSQCGAPFVPKMAEIDGVFETGRRKRLLGSVWSGQAAMM